MGEAWEIQHFSRTRRSGKAVDTLYRALKGKVAELHSIGDALAPRRLIHAVHDGARAAQAL